MFFFWIFFIFSVNGFLNETNQWAWPLSGSFEICIDHRVPQNTTFENILLSRFIRTKVMCKIFGYRFGLFKSGRDRKFATKL